MEFVRVAPLRTVLHVLLINIHAKSAQKETLSFRGNADYVLSIVCAAILMDLILAMMDCVSWATPN